MFRDDAFEVFRAIADGPGAATRNPQERKSAWKCRTELVLFVVSANVQSSPTWKEQAMKVMVMVKATRNSEAGVLPTEKLLAEMGNFNEQLVKAGIMQVGEGLHPSSKGKRVALSGGKRVVTDGPFTETKELLAGFWIWQVRSMEEAVEWVKRCPDPMPGEESQIEIRPLFEAEDFGKEFTPELRAQEERLRATIERGQAR
jgi:hypothetical protein